MQPPICRLCREAHWLREPHRFKDRPKDETDKAPPVAGKPKRETLKPTVETLTETLSQPETADETLRACAVCEKRFTPARVTAQYCSAACRLKAFRTLRKRL